MTATFTFKNGKFKVGKGNNLTQIQVDSLFDLENIIVDGTEICLSTIFECQQAQEKIELEGGSGFMVEQTLWRILSYIQDFGLAGLKRLRKIAFFNKSGLLYPEYTKKDIEKMSKKEIQEKISELNRTCVYIEHNMFKLQKVYDSL